MKTRLFMSNSK